MTHDLLRVAHPFDDWLQSSSNGDRKIQNNSDGIGKKPDQRNQMLPTENEIQRRMDGSTRSLSLSARSTIRSQRKPTLYLDDTEHNKEFFTVSQPNSPSSGTKAIKQRHLLRDIEPKVQAISSEAATRVYNEQTKPLSEKWDDNEIESIETMTSEKKKSNSLSFVGFDPLSPTTNVPNNCAGSFGISNSKADLNQKLTPTTTTTTTASTTFGFGMMIPQRRKSMDAKVNNSILSPSIKKEKWMNKPVSCTLLRKSSIVSSSSNDGSLETTSTDIKSQEEKSSSNRSASYRSSRDKTRSSKSTSGKKSRRHRSSTKDEPESYKSSDKDRSERKKKKKHSEKHKKRSSKSSDCTSPTISSSSPETPQPKVLPVQANTLTNIRWKWKSITGDEIQLPPAFREIASFVPKKTKQKMTKKHKSSNKSSSHPTSTSNGNNMTSNEEVPPVPPAFKNVASKTTPIAKGKKFESSFRSSSFASLKSLSSDTSKHCEDGDNPPVPPAFKDIATFGTPTTKRKVGQQREQASSPTTNPKSTTSNVETPRNGVPPLPPAFQNITSKIVPTTTKSKGRGKRFEAGFRSSSYSSLNSVSTSASKHSDYDNHDDDPPPVPPAFASFATLPIKRIIRREHSDPCFQVSSSSNTETSRNGAPPLPPAFQTIATKFANATAKTKARGKRFESNLRSNSYSCLNSVCTSKSKGTREDENPQSIPPAFQDIASFNTLPTKIKLKKDRKSLPNGQETSANSMSTSTTDSVSQTTTTRTSNGSTSFEEKRLSADDDEVSTSSVFTNSFFALPPRQDNSPSVGQDSILTWTYQPTKNFSDWKITIITTEEGSEDITSYYVHRNIVGCGPRGSNYFHKLCTAKKDSDSTTIRLKASAAHAFPDMLDYMYGSYKSHKQEQDKATNFSARNAVALRYLSSTFGLPALFDDINQFIQNDLSKYNIHNYVNEANEYDDEALIKMTTRIAARS